MEATTSTAAAAALPPAEPVTALPQAEPVAGLPPAEPVAVLPPAEPVAGVAPAPEPAPVYGGASLYVGDLDQSVGNEELYNTFLRAAPVVSVRVCRDELSRISLGYGYVNFEAMEHAVTAMEALNFTPINGKPIRIMFSHRDPNARKSNKANLFVKNLDEIIDNKTLFDIFSAFGTVLSCKVNTDSAGQSLGFGFVQLDSEKAAQTAIEKLNGMLVNGKKVYVGVFVSKSEREMGGKKDIFTNLFVKNLPSDFTDEILKREFGKFGEITSCVVMKDELGNSKGFGFVNFENADVALLAVEKMNGKVYEDRVLYVGRAQKKAEREKELRERFEREKIKRREKMQGCNLFMKNLDDSIEDGNLRELFSQFGEITSCKVMVDALGRSKGSGFVAFTTSEAADQAMKEMNGKLIGRKPLYVALAQRKEDRRAMLMARFAQLQLTPSITTSTTPGMLYPHLPVAPSPRLPLLPPAQQQPLYFPPPPGPAGPGLVPVSPHTGYGYMRPPVTPSPNYMLPFGVPPRQQRVGVRGGPGAPRQHQHQHQQLMHNQGYRYSQNGRSTADQNGILPVQNGTVRTGPIPISALSTTLASETPHNQRLILGEQLYPLVEQIERDQAGKVTGMLLEMDQTEVLHLIESPDALKSKVNEAIQVLRLSNGN